MARPPEDDSFLSRWSKRKRVGTVAPEPEPDLSAPDAAPDAVESLSEEDLAALPSLDMFTIETDIRPFLQKGVPLAMRNAALRKKWMLTPSIRDHADPAVDYAWDWNTPGGVPGDGVGPSAQRAAEMLRDLTRPRGDAASAIAQETGAESTPQPSPPTTDIAPQRTLPEQAAGAAPDARDTKTQRSDEADIRKENQSDIENTPLRRRHGSALPD